MALLQSYPAKKMTAYKVSTRVNSPKNNDAEINSFTFAREEFIANPIGTAIAQRSHFGADFLRRAGDVDDSRRDPRS
jgi:hypothetical protein